MKVTMTIEQLTRIYNYAYNSGHDDTAEGCDCPAHHTEMDNHHREDVEDIAIDMGILPKPVVEVNV